MDATAATTQPGAVVLLSGGLDSATVLAIARDEGFACTALSFDYGQRHRFELEAARLVARAQGIEDHRVVRLDAQPFAGSALTTGGAVPKDRSADAIGAGIPSTYVPARNLVFLSIATGLAEGLAADAVFIGVNAVDYSGYPDCRPAFIEAFARAANLATSAGVSGRTLTIHTPLMELTKAQIIQRGVALGVDYGLTHSCYDPADDGGACGRCDACELRARGFEQAGVPDPTPYAPAGA